MAVKSVKKETTENGKTEQEACLFSKTQLLAAKRFQGRRDIVNALLSENKQYAAETVEQMIENYKKGQVK